MDLTGFWTGAYWYLDHGQPMVSFFANLINSGGRLDGSISEVDKSTGFSLPIESFVLGSHEGSSVKFAKVYDGSGPYAHRVDYNGTLSGDGTTISGSWYLEGEWGGFEMSRQLLESDELTDEAIENSVTIGMKAL